jgi:hypothetical protein
VTCLGVSAGDVLLALSTLFAAAAAWAGLVTVRDSRRFHVDAERDRQVRLVYSLAEDAADIAALARKIANGAHVLETEIIPAIELFQVHVDATGEDLPHCRLIAVRGKGVNIGVWAGEIADRLSDVLAEIREVAEQVAARNVRE